MGWGGLGNTGIDRARAACLAIAGSLQAGATVSLVAWGPTPRTLLDSHAVSGPGDSLFSAHCRAMEAYGASNFHDGLVAAYALAQKNFGADAINRIVLISDGGANVGATDETLIAGSADDADGEAITLLGVGVGDPWNYNDPPMNAVTDAGKGACVFFDRQDEVQRALLERFLQHVEVAARNVRVELTLPPSFKMLEFHGEEYSTVPSEVEPQHLAMNDVLVFHQVVDSCAPEVLTDLSELRVVARYGDSLSVAKTRPF